jgi:hypothetical protein
MNESAIPVMNLNFTNKLQAKNEDIIKAEISRKYGVQFDDERKAD